MRLLLSGVFFTVLAATSAIAQVDPKIHKLCIEAKDYAGCVKAMTNTGEHPSRTITSQGADITEGNQCNAGFAYIGGGNCQSVRCEYNSSGFNALGHDSLIAGKKDSSGKDVWGCKFNFWYGSGVLRLSGATTRLTVNKNCPEGEPQLGYNNTCQTTSKPSMSQESTSK